MAHSHDLRCHKPAPAERADAANRSVQDDCRLMLATALELMESIARAHARAMNLIQHAARLQRDDERAAERAVRPPQSCQPPTAQPVPDGADAHTGGTGADGVRGLTPQERRVLTLMSRGLSNRVIARQLGLSEQTIKNYLSTAFRKLGVTSRTEAAFYVLQAEAAPPDPDAPAHGAPARRVPEPRPGGRADTVPPASPHPVAPAPTGRSVRVEHDTQERR
ncbi:response regulator transcription factor [Streptomyces sp. SudanB182_2057]|uniref:helix-turn-helix transcriptional regulator n=1 Tax=Streptomyces sp. SudanB182_2057 TaxID=3035281 RepID=UPI003F55CCEE